MKKSTSQRRTTAKTSTSVAGANVERLLTPHDEWLEYQSRQTELEATMAEASTALDEWLRSYHRRRDFGNICGASVKLRTKFGHVVSPLQVVIAINVREKLTLEECKERRWKVLEEIGGFRVKVLEGQFAPIPQANALFLRGRSDKQNPLPLSAEVVGGIPIATPINHLAFGTLGLVYAAGAHRLGITCKHVIESGFQVDQLGLEGSLPVSRRLGHVVAAVGSPNPNHTLGGRTESLDCAVVEISGGSDVVLPPSGSWIRGLTHPLDAEPSASEVVPMFYSKRQILGRDKGAKIWKFGVGTGTIAIGRLDTTNHATLDVGGIPYMKNFTVHPFNNRNGTFVLPGDSGSLLAIEARVDGGRAFIAIGVLFATLAANMSVGLACNINHVIDALKLPIPRRLLKSDWETP